MCTLFEDTPTEWEPLVLYPVKQTSCLVTAQLYLLDKCIHFFVGKVKLARW